VSGPAAKLEPWFSCELATWRRRTGLPVLEPPQLSEPYRSQLRRQDQAAATWWAEHGCPYDAALALHDSGEPSALRTALNEFRRLGARPAATIVARRLREAGELRVPRGPRATTAANPAGLTGREVEVLALLAEGMVNRDIAARLVVSPRTVDHHVAAILHKLEVGDRAGAVGAAARLGLLPQK
jgi:ATP/maltotriose-dependent transcriptional regulator MalT